MEPGIVLVVIGVACVFAAILAAAAAFIVARRAAKWISAGLALVFVIASVGLFIRAPLAPANASAPVADGLTLISAVNGRVGATLSALSARDGITARWRHSAGAFVSAAPVVRDGVVYVTNRAPGGNGGDAVTALRIADGSTLWHTTFSSSLLSAPAIADGHVFVMALRITSGPPDRQIIALDTATGKETWRQSIADTFFFSPDTHPLSAGGGLVVIAGSATDTAGILALRATDGQIAWTAPVTPGGSRADVIISDGMLLALMTGSAGSQQIRALRLSDGAPLWTTSGTWTSHGAFVVTADALYLATQDNSAITNPANESAGQFVYAYALRDGSPRWRHPTDSPTLSLASAGDTLFVSTTHALHALRLTDGSELWHRDGADNTLLAAPGALFAVSTAAPDGPRLCPLTPCSSATIQLSALSLRDGSPYWNIQTDSPPLIALAGA
ncbi:MAG TPA: PQQ-binding-like beta-propeller repeat protein [Ktedonobacterales bacterium]|nr:PQQ-binding-like beta-propeller repeat protein [Ktedonobacterales bacterium]